MALIMGWGANSSELAIYGARVRYEREDRGWRLAYGLAAGRPRRELMVIAREMLAMEPASRRAKRGVSKTATDS